MLLGVSTPGDETKCVTAGVSTTAAWQEPGNQGFWYLGRSSEVLLGGQPAEMEGKNEEYMKCVEEK